ncbi:MAG: hypothetical protein WAZ12_00055 [Candidatus Absconditicoccaceae bacterium]
MQGTYKGMAVRMIADISDEQWTGSFFSAEDRAKMVEAETKRSEQLLFWLGEHAEAPERLWPNDD